MSKKFYVVIPYTGSGINSNKDKGFIEKIFGASKKPSFREEAQRFEEQRSQIEQRVAIVKNGLSRFGVRSEQVNTEQAIEVFYNMFNPGETHRNIPQIQK
jgi:hypothetical protein